MAIKVLVIPADHSKPVEAREIEPSLDQMQALVGGWLEVVDVLEPLGSMYLNEEGKLRRLPLNQRATALIQRHNAMLLDVIVGDAFVSGPPDREGQDTDCPLEYLGLADV